MRARVLELHVAAGGNILKCGTASSRDAARERRRHGRGPRARRRVMGSGCEGGLATQLSTRARLRAHENDAYHPTSPVLNARAIGDFPSLVGLAPLSVAS